MSADPPATATATAVTPVPTARWKLLKRALVPSSAATPDGQATSPAAAAASVRRHAGFPVLPSEVPTPEEMSAALAVAPPHAAADAGRFQYVRYRLPDRFQPAALYFRLRRPDAVRLSELSPAQQVDNTGNICVWNSEEVLAYLALQMIFPATTTAAAATTPAASQPATPDDGPPLQPPQLPQATCSTQLEGGDSASSPLRILELGAGMSGLCGLALAYARLREEAPTSTSTSPPARRRHRISEIVITDGNTTCIEEGVRHQLAWNVAMHQATSPAAGVVTPRVSAEVLQWDRRADYSTMGQFDVILVADCLFFESFHIDLCHVLRSLLTPDTGRAFLLAPTRGGSLDKFVRLVEAESSPTAATATPAAGETDRAQSSRTLHVASLARRYDDAIWQQHLAFLQATSATEGDRPSYAPDLHYPLLLTLAVTKGT